MSGHQALLFFHLFAIALASGVGFVNLWSLRVGKNQSIDVLEAIAFQQKSLRNFGYGLVLIILGTGIWQVVNLGGISSQNSWFHAKLAFVAIWLMAYFAMRISVAQLRDSRDGAHSFRINMLAHISWISAAIAMFCAVMAFAT